MASNSSLEDLEEIIYLQQQIEYRYLKYLDFIGLEEKKIFN